jgi:hypothetical protein
VKHCFKIPKRQSANKNLSLVEQTSNLFQLEP